MAIVVSGASGLLGRKVYESLGNALKSGVLQDITLKGLCHSRQSGDLQPIDLTNKQVLKDFFEVVQPKVIVHCAAERRPDVVEKSSDDALAVNVTATENICQLANSRDAWVLFISTDYVFDGKNPPYDINAEPNPLNTYGKMKLAGEKVVLDSSSENAVLRIPILYGPVEYFGESAVTVLWEKVRDTEKPCLMDHKQKRYPTHTESVADTITQMVVRHIEQRDSVSGIYHFSEPTMLTKYDMAVRMAEVMNLPNSHIKADLSEEDSSVTRRPSDCQLITSRLTGQGFSLAKSDFNSSIKEIISTLNSRSQ